MMPDLVPVDYDPFAVPQLTPVDHDPFGVGYSIDQLQTPGIDAINSTISPLDFVGPGLVGAMARSAVAVAREGATTPMMIREAAKLLDPAPGATRVYHGGTFNHPTAAPWVTTNRDLAEAHAALNPNGKLFYMDLPNDHPGIVGGGTFQLPSEEAGKLTPVISIPVEHDPFASVPNAGMMR